MPLKSRLKNNGTAYLFIAPAMCGIIIFKILPVLMSFKDSFYDLIYGRTLEKVFVGFQNYAMLFSDFVFWKSLRVTLLLTVIINPLQIMLALILALLLQRKKAGTLAIRSLFLIPIGVSMPIATVVWGLILNPQQGLANSILYWLGFQSQPFLTSPKQALLSIVLIASWKGVSFWMLFVLAGLQDIPQPLYEAARIDGVNIFQELLLITLPLIKRTLVFVTVSATTMNFLLFVPMYLLTRGGPQLSTNVLMYEAYRSGFVYQDFSRSMTLVSVLILMISLVVGLQFKLFKSDE